MMVIRDVKFDTNADQILQNSSQEPSMSSKYDCVLDALLIMQGSWKTAYKPKLTYDGYSWCQIWYKIWPNPPTLQSGTINTLQVWMSSWWISIHARELKIVIQFKNGIFLWSMMSNLTPKMAKFSRYPVRNHECHSSMTMFPMHL